MGKEQKIPILEKSRNKLDLLKFFFQIGWEIKILDDKKYIAISERLNEIGRMLGGWIKGLQNKTPAT
ncbi:MAG: four helix bundle protein [Patescibacteria group bacterium]